MAVKLRLKRMGAKRKPFYRVIAIDSRSKRDGREIELLGTYNPNTDPAEIKIDNELALKWLRTGAQPSDTVRSLLSKTCVMETFHNEKYSKGNK